MPFRSPSHFSSGGRDAGFNSLVKPEVTGSIAGVSHKFKNIRIIIPACLIKQSNGTLSRMCDVRANVNQG